MIIVLLLCRGLKFCCDANSEADHFQVPTAVAAAGTSSATSPPAITSVNTVTDTRLSMGTNEHMQHRTAMGTILIDENDDGTDEDEIDLNAASSSSADADNKASIILSADFGDNNVHPMEETSCSICLIKYQHGDRIQRNAFDGYGDSDASNNHSSDLKNRCDHVFHPECITSWIKTNTGDGECPICRRPFILISPV